jgi:hypothetical protein
MMVEAFMGDVEPVAAVIEQLRQFSARGNGYAHFGAAGEPRELARRTGKVGVEP